MESITNIKVEQLADIVESQLCLHGNHKVFVRGLENDKSFALFVDDEFILDCCNYDDSNLEDMGLEFLASKLEELEPNSVILCSCEEVQSAGFQLGIKTREDGFVETLNSSELSEATIVLEN